MAKIETAVSTADVVVEEAAEGVESVLAADAFVEKVLAEEEKSSPATSQAEQPAKAERPKETPEQYARRRYGAAHRDFERLSDRFASVAAYAEDITAMQEDLAYADNAISQSDWQAAIDYSKGVEQRIREVQQSARVYSLKRKVAGLHKMARLIVNEPDGVMYRDFFLLLREFVGEDKTSFSWLASSENIFDSPLGTLDEAFKVMNTIEGMLAKKQLPEIVDYLRRNLSHVRGEDRDQLVRIQIFMGVSQERLTNLASSESVFERKLTADQALAAARSLERMLQDKERERQESLNASRARSSGSHESNGQRRARIAGNSREASNKNGKGK